MNKWLYQSNLNLDAPVKLICFPYAGGGTLAYRKWAPQLSKDINLCIMNYPGRENRFNEPRVLSFQELLDNIMLSIESVIGGKTILFGHSYGALTAMLIASYVGIKKSSGVKHLIVSGRPYDTGKNAVFIKPDGLSDEALFSVVSERYQGTPDEIIKSPDLKKLYMPIMRDDFKMYQTYHDNKECFPIIPIESPITAIGFKDEYYDSNDMLGWGNCTKGDFFLHMLDGGHFAFLQDHNPLVEIINDIARQVVKEE